jgi:hypothetical protein
LGELGKREEGKAFEGGEGWSHVNQMLKRSGNAEFNFYFYFQKYFFNEGK